ncbi:recombinase family protein [Anoxybacillus sp. ST4]|uniref:recombinase family protein n=1 Tax=Anoxybacillus sp. ST4 TaxID=2864181 RepID=UPI001C63E192|nr:recombinase family protein [Anoxybacillus sp. ST4]MBW7649775.1 recombinase family protein [Anoxybacillus sp. ST4]
MKVAIYTRVSTDHEEQLSSLKNQEEYYRNYCNERGYEIYKIYADEGFSGVNIKREQFLQMLYEAGLDVHVKKNGQIEFEISERKPKFRMIITKDVSRFARNINAIEIARTLKKNNVHIFFENANLDTKMDDWEFRLGLFLLFSQQESIDRSKKVRFGKLQKAKKGKYVMPVPLFGYEYDADKGKYVVNEEEAEIVKEIFKMYTEQNVGTRTIAHELNQRGIKTRRGKKWDGTAVKRLLINEKYIGQVILNRYTKPDVTYLGRKIERNPSEWIIFDNAIPPIIDKETFEKAQEILEQRVRELPDGTKKGSKIVKNIFHKKLICAKCGAYFTRVTSTKERKKLNTKIVECNYFCRNRRIRGICDMKGISHNTLEREIMKFSKEKIMRDMIAKRDKEEQLYEMLMKIQRRKRENIEKERQRIQNQINDVNNQINVLLDSFINRNETNELVIAATQRKIEQLEQKRQELEQEKARYDIYHIEQEELRIQRSYEKIQEMYKKETYTFEELLSLISKIKVYEETDEGRELEFFFNLPTMLAYVLEDEVEDVETEIMLHSWKIKIK